MVDKYLQELEMPGIAADVRQEVGQIISGSLSKGLRMKLHPSQSVEDVRAGKFVVVDGEKHQYFSMITDVELNTSASGVEDNPPSRENRLLQHVLSGTTAYGTVELRPMLMLSKESAAVDSEEELLPVKSIPAHFSAVYGATASDVCRIFGEEKADSRYFNIGTPLDMEEIPVCLNLERFVERSNGIFGKSGTGKTFLTRIVLCGIIKNQKAVNLIFDMHSEYGWQGTFEGSRGSVRGLKQYFQDRVSVFTLDPESSRRRGVRTDFDVKIPYSQVTAEDIMLLQNELNLTPTAAETCYMLVNQFEKKWLSELLRMDGEEIREFCGSHNVHEASLSALQRKLRVLADSCESFLIDDAVAQVDVDAVRQIISYLQGGKHVVVEFGQHTQPLRYMLVANILTRRIHRNWVKKKEESLGGTGEKPLSLVITIEEAHKFLSPQLADQTIFGTIAREMRKYNVTLLVVDQRPSGIDSEILSQIGTKIVCLLNDEDDINAVLTGVSNSSGLKGILATLDSKQQALVIGHAVPMPVVVKTREYDNEEFRLSMGTLSQEELSEKIAREIDKDFA